MVTNVKHLATKLLRAFNTILYRKLDVSDKEGSEIYKV